jgi:hypothetical protein
MRAGDAVVKASDSVMVDRPIHDVFGFLADCTNNHLWRPGVSLSARISDGSAPTGAGTRYMQKVTAPDGRTTTETYEITRFEEPTLLEFAVELAGVPTRGRFTLARVDAGTTHVELSYERSSGPLRPAWSGQDRDELQQRARDLQALPAAMKDHEA